MSQFPPIDPSGVSCPSCGYNLTGVSIGGQCPECGASVNDAITSYQRTHGVGGLETVSYVAPILATVCCCVIGGVVSIVYTAKANTAAAVGDADAYVSAKSARTGWMIAAMIIGLLAVLAQVTVLLLGP